MERTYTIIITAHNIEEAHDALTESMRNAQDSGIVEEFEIVRMEGN